MCAEGVVLQGKGRRRVVRSENAARDCRVVIFVKANGVCAIIRCTKAFPMCFADFVECCRYVVDQYKINWT